MVAGSKIAWEATVVPGTLLVDRGKKHFEKIGQSSDARIPVVPTSVNEFAASGQAVSASAANSRTMSPGVGQHFKSC